MGIAHWVVLLIIGMGLLVVGVGVASVGTDGSGGVTAVGGFIALFGLILTWLVSGFIMPKIVGSRWLSKPSLL